MSFKDLTERETAVDTICSDLSQLSLDFSHFHNTRIARITTQTQENQTEMLSITDKITELEIKLAQLRRAEQECRDVQETLIIEH